MRVEVRDHLLLDLWTRTPGLSPRVEVEEEEGWTFVVWMRSYLRRRWVGAALLRAFV